MFSPTEGKVVGSLSDGHEKEVKDFKFLPDDNLEAWSIGGDGKLVQWDLRKDKAIRFAVMLAIARLLTTNSNQIIFAFRHIDSEALYPFPNTTTNPLRLVPPVCHRHHFKR